jgi:hypothetical protein
LEFLNFTVQEASALLKPVLEKALEVTSWIFL